MQTKKNSRKVGGSSGNPVYEFGGLEPGTQEPESNYINPSSIPPPLPPRGTNKHGVLPPRSSDNPLRFKRKKNIINRHAHARREMWHKKQNNLGSTRKTHTSNTLTHMNFPEVTRGGGSRKRRVKKKVRRTRKNKKKLSRK